MFKIQNKTFHVSRGDSGTIHLNLKNTTFLTGDEVAFRIYEVQGLDTDPIVEVLTVAEADGPTVDIVLTSDDTNFGELGNEVVDYWYEVKVNESRTILGYDDSGAKIFKLYPTGVSSIE